MVKISNVQSDFRGGFWSPNAQGGFENPLYSTALNECLNSYPLSEGAWTRRPGFILGSYTRAGRPAKLLPAAGRNLKSYNLELTEEHVRIHAGPSLVTEGNMKTVETISDDVFGIITVTLPHGWAIGDEVVFFMAGGAAVPDPISLLFNRVFTIEPVGVDGDQFVLHDSLTDASFDGLSIVWDASYAVQVAKVADATTPYVGESWREVNVVQSPDRTLLLHPKFPAHDISLTQATDSAVVSFEGQEADFIDGPYLDQFKGVIANCTTGVDGLVAVIFDFKDWADATSYPKDFYVKHDGWGWRSLVNANTEEPGTGTQWVKDSPITFVNGGTGFSETDLGRHVRLHSEPPKWDALESYNGGDVVKWNGIYWTALGNQSAGVTPIKEGSSAFASVSEMINLLILKKDATISSKEPGVAADTWAPNLTAHKWTWGKIVDLSVTGKVDVSLEGTVFGSFNHNDKLFDGLHGGYDVDAPLTVGESGYAGINFTVPTAISSARVWPAQLQPFYNETTQEWIFDGTFAFAGIATATLNLRASHTLPSSASDGTIIGTSGLLPSGMPVERPISIISTDTDTAWEYVWVEITVSVLQSTPYAGDIPVVTVVATEIQLYNSTAVVGTGITVELHGDSLLYDGAIEEWRLGRYNASDPTFPVCGCYYGGRIWLASDLNHFDGFFPNQGLLHRPTEPDGTVTEASGISYTYNSISKNPIQWMVPTDDGILVGNEDAEYLIFAPTTGPIAASNIQIERRSKFGTAKVQPVEADLTTVFVHRNERDIHEHMRDAYSGKLTAPSLTKFSKSLTKSGVAQLARQSSLVPIVWGNTKDGRLIGTTYQRSNLISANDPDFNGWHHHTHGAEREFISVSVVQGVGGNLDALAVITQDPNTTLCRYEIASDLMEADDDIMAAYFLDGGVVPASGDVFAITAAPPIPDEGGEGELEQISPTWEHLFCASDIRSKVRRSATGGANPYPTFGDFAFGCLGWQVPGYNYGTNFTVPAAANAWWVAFGPSQFSGTRMTVSYVCYFAGPRTYDIQAIFSPGINTYKFYKVEL